MPTILKLIQETNVPVRVTDSPNKGFTSATFWGYSGFDANGLGLSNSSTIYMGQTSGMLPVAIGTGGSFFNWSLQAKSTSESLSNFWINGNAGNGVFVVYYE